MHSTKAAENIIHPTAVIDKTVRLGNGNFIGAFAVITGDVVIGDGNWIGAHVVIGSPAQYVTKKFEFQRQQNGNIKIGDRNVLREFVTVHQPSEDQTIIDNDCYVMAYAHISHDTHLCDSVGLANSVQIGGFSEVQRFANVGLSAVLHQFTTIGAYAMIGMGSVISRDVPPFLTVAGNPGRVVGVNRIGLTRNGFSEAEVDHIALAFQSGRLPTALSTVSQDVIRLFLDRNERTGRGKLSFGPSTAAR